MSAYDHEEMTQKAEAYITTQFAAAAQFAEADSEILRFHIALERGYVQPPDIDAVILLCKAVLHAGLVSEAGFGMVPVSYLTEVSSKVATAVERGRETGVWRVGAALADDLANVDNEYDRQLRETRLGVIRQAEADARWALANREPVEQEMQRYQRQQTTS